MSAATRLSEATEAFLARHPPFASMSVEGVRALAGTARLTYTPPGEPLLAAGGEAVGVLRVIQRGTVQRLLPGAEGLEPEALHAGEVFPLSAVLEQRPAAATYRALDDVFCLEIDGATLRRVAAGSAELQAFAARRLRRLLEQSGAALQAKLGQAASTERSMSASLQTLLARAPVACAPHTPVGEVLATMSRERIGCMVVVDEDQRPLGLLTERDVVDRAAHGRLCDTTVPIASLMTEGVIALPATAGAGEAMLCMIRHGIRHVVVTREGRLTGVVSQRDLFALQRLSLFRVAGRIDAAGGEAELVAAAEDSRQLARLLLAQGVQAESLTALVSELNDRIVRRALAMVGAATPPPALPWAWLALGSEGRAEQTLATDQDNGLVFEPPAPLPGAALAALRERFVAWAKSVNALLDRCGFPLCRGGIMAGNPQWCLTLDEWQQRFGDWLRNPQPEALLHASVFFDLRAVGGQVALADRLLAWLATEAPARPAFLQQLARNALQTRPPLGLFGGLAGSGRGRDPAAIDLKLHGTRLFVDAARVMALARGVTVAGTVARLRAAAAAGGFPAGEAEAASDAFQILQQFRLRMQLGDAAGVEGEPNAVRADALNEFDRRVLKEALLQARRVQQTLSIDWQA